MRVVGALVPIQSGAGALTRPEEVAAPGPRRRPEPAGAEVDSDGATLRASAISRAVVGGRWSGAAERGGRLPRRLRRRPRGARGRVPATARPSSRLRDVVVAVLAGARGARRGRGVMERVADLH